MPLRSHSHPHGGQGLMACGGLLAAGAVALSAYASHGASGAAQSGLQSAALFAFGHGIALAALSLQTPRTMGRIALLALLFGTLLFAGSLAAGHFFGLSTKLAPAGGLLMIVGWLLYAIDALRR